jgi:hypothetical protein
MTRPVWRAPEHSLPAFAVSQLVGQIRGASGHALPADWWHERKLTGREPGRQR